MKFELISFSFIFLFVTSVLTQEKKSKVDLIKSLTNWATKYNITFPKIELAPANYSDPYLFPTTKYTFRAKADISIGEPILTIPCPMNISVDSVLPLVSKKMKKGWETLNSTTVPLYQTPYLKEQSFLALLIERSLRLEKGKFYNKFKPYLKLVDKFSNTDTYPLLLSDKELMLIQDTLIGRDILSNKKYIIDEEKFITNDMGFTPSSYQYLRNRVLLDSKIQYIDNKATVLPLVEFCLHRPFPFANANIYPEQGGFINIRAMRGIKEGETIIMDTKMVSNSMNFMYYGFTMEENHMFGPNIINAFHDGYRKETSDIINWNTNNHFIDIADENFYNEVERIYRTVLGKDKPMKEIAETIAKNLIYYLWEYKKITPENFDKVIINKYNQKNLLKLFEEEQRMIRYRIKHYEEKYNLNLKSYNINDKDYLERSDL